MQKRGLYAGVAAIAIALFLAGTPAPSHAQPAGDPAPNAAAAAEYYTGMYGYSLLRIPPASDFPGTGEKDNKIPETMKNQHYWIDTVKNACQSCHAIGTHGIRVVPKEFQETKDSGEAWTRRLQAGQAMTNMAIVSARLGPDKGIALFADWTDR